MADQPMAEEGKFAVGEKCFVPHPDKYYEAKILKAEFRGQTGWHYFLHYNGWNKKYDEWVEENGLVKAEVAEAAGAAPAVSKIKKAAGLAIQGPGALAVAQGRVVGAAGGGGRSGGRGSGGATAAAAGGTGPSMGLDIDLPPLLKKYLIDDFENVFEENRFVPLPRTPCISDCLERYVQESKELRTGTVDAEEEVASGLQSYFDKCLLPLLLYRNERGQAGQALSDGRCPSAVYGCEHLLRLIHKLPDILPMATLTDEQLATIATMVQDVVTWIAENHTTVLLPKDQYLPPAEPAMLPPGAAPGAAPGIRQQQVA